MAAWNATVSVTSMWGFAVKLELATESSAKASNVSFKQVHKECLTPIKRPAWCPQHEKFLEPEEIGKGLPQGKGEPIVLVNEDELAALKAEPSSEMEVVRFCQIAEIDPKWFDRTYYLLPDGKQDSYAVFLRALEESGLGGICHYARAGHEKWGIMRPLDGLIGLETLFLAEDVRPQAGLEFDVSKVDLGYAQTIIDAMTEPFVGELLVSEYRDELHDLLARTTTKGGKAKAKAKPKTKGETTTAALKASVAEIKKKKKAA